MITPRFSCQQTEESVIINIYCPSVRASDVEIHVDGTLFTVHINPYFLRLNFPHSVVEDDETAARYDPSSGYLAVTLTKETKGQVFEDLDLLAKLLAPRPSGARNKAPLIEVLDSSETGDAEEEELIAATRNLSLEQHEILEAAENDWQLPQEVPDGSEPMKTASEQRYGFLDAYTGYFRHVQHTENEVNELGDETETCGPIVRRQKRLAHEDSKWDEEYYMVDFADDEYIQELITWKHPHAASMGDFEYSESEKLTMLRLPRKEYLTNAAQETSLYLALVSILFSYAYDSRTTQHDPTSESGWTISTLTAIFSALDTPPYGFPSEGETSKALPPEARELAAVFTTSYRRSLSFPLYRSFALAEACRSDVVSFLTKGKRTVLRCLLEVKDILDHHDVYYVYSKIWIDDFCVWIQTSASDEALVALGNAAASLSMEKSWIGWDLEDLEALAQSDSQREADSDDESGSEGEVERMLPAPL